MKPVRQRFVGFSFPAHCLPVIGFTRLRPGDRGKLSEIPELIGDVINDHDFNRRPNGFHAILAD